MKIGIDISQIVYGTGVSWYTRNLVDALLKIDKENQYILFGGYFHRLGDLKSQVNSFRGNFIAKYFPIPPVAADIIWNQLHIVPIDWLIGTVDVFHTSDWAEPPCSYPKVTTIHDLSPFVFPDSAGKDGIRDVLKTQKRKYEWVKKESSKIITPSESTKKDIVKYLNIPTEKIVVIYEAPDAIFKKQADEVVERVKNKYGITGNYAVSVGTSKRKNLERITRAVASIDELRHVVVGLGALQPTSSELAALYSGAEMLVFASLYEGFGLPILEAFACGCPVVTSNISSMPEVAGNAAVLVDPTNEKAITNGIKTALANKEDFVKRGYERIKEFSWEKAAKETLEVYANRN